ncbi:hypothetical protein E2C01_100145 [Portunus trituberculatus]|uniref:Uncharacterized protein n=1 Tax=Portunus trituberculatus TaxID=210409 RepID=A0A5B7KCJ9_PORTR|nr:hypothetical protein [Portunus trituberculatus]
MHHRSSLPASARTILPRSVLSRPAVTPADPNTSQWDGQRFTVSGRRGKFNYALQVASAN